MTRATNRATVASVAQAAGVSPATVSRVLNRHPNVSPELVARVNAAADEVGYPRTPAASARPRTKLWMAIVPDVETPFFMRLLDSFDQAADAAGCSVLIGNSRDSPERERTHIATAIDHRVSGVLIAAASVNSDLDPLRQAGIPVVTVDREVTGFSGDNVGVNNHRAGELAAQHLLAQGVSRPALMTGPDNVNTTVEREEGFLATLAAAGIDLGPTVRLRERSRHAHRVAAAMVLDHPDIDAVFATNSWLTAGAFAALQRSTRRMPDDVALIGIDDDPWTALVTPAVSVIGQPIDQLGSWAGRLLTARADGLTHDHARVSLDPVLVPRASTRRR